MFLIPAIILAVGITGGYVFLNSQKPKEVTIGTPLNQTQIENIIKDYAKIKKDSDTKPLENRNAYPAKGIRINFNTLGYGYQKNIDLERTTLVTKAHDDFIKNRNSSNTIYLNKEQVTKVLDLLNIIWKTRISELANKNIQCNDLYRDIVLTDENFSKSLNYWCPIENKTVRELDDYVRSIE